MFRLESSNTGGITGTMPSTLHYVRDVPDPFDSVHGLKWSIFEYTADKEHVHFNGYYFLYAYEDEIF